MGYLAYKAAKAGGFYAAAIGSAANSLLADFRLQKLSDLVKTLRKRTVFCSAIDKEYAADSLPAAYFHILESRSHCWKSSSEMISRSHFFFSSLAFSLQA